MLAHLGARPWNGELETSSPRILIEQMPSLCMIFLVMGETPGLGGSLFVCWTFLATRNGHGARARALLISLCFSPVLNKSILLCRPAFN